MSFSRALARLAAQILLAVASFLWIVIAIFERERPETQIGMAIGGALALASLVRLGKGGPWVPWTAAIGMIAPIGVLAHNNGASPWLWALWLLGIIGTARWVRDGHEVGK